MQAPAATAPKKAGLEILVEFKRGSVEVLRVARLRHVPRAHLHAPAVTEANLSSLKRGQIEVVLSILDAGGESLGSFGFSSLGRYYLDSGNPRIGTITGGPRTLDQGEPDLRAIRVPWSDKASYLFFHQSEVVETPRGLDVRRTSLIACHDGAERGPSPERVPHDLPMPRFVPIPWATPWLKKPRPLPIPGAVPDAQDGWYVDSETTVKNGDPADQFDIVITGDGFQGDEQSRTQFNDWAETLRLGLQSMAPFDRVASLINWHIVRVASTDSGIDHCPAPLDPPRRTFYQVEGCWEGTNAPGFLGTNELGRIQWAAEHIAPWEDVDLVIIIANCNVWGGHAWPDWKTAIVSACDHRFLELAAHECGHVISKLAEERIVCIEEDPSWPDPNLTRFPAVSQSVLRHAGSPIQPASAPGGPLIARDTVWWKNLADKDTELNEDGTFKAVHVYGDAIDPNDHKCPKEEPGLEGAVGAFWGCQDTKDRSNLERAINILFLAHEERWRPLMAILRDLLALSAPPREMPEPPACNDYWDPRGAYYYRGAARCRMRYVTYEFCPVCQHLLVNSIRDANGLAPLMPVP